LANAGFASSESETPVAQQIGKALSNDMNQTIRQSGNTAWGTGETTEAVSAPRPTLRARDAVALLVGIVIGAGIFKTPQMVAANSSSVELALAAWVLGGIISLIGALCYAELATTYPNTGGEYHYLTRAFGNRLSFLFAWARMAVLQTGSIALLAFVFGDYASKIVPLGEYSSALYAALVIIVLTALNAAGVRQGTRTQNLLTAIEVLGVLLVIVVGLTASAPATVTASAATAPAVSGSASLGLMMVFVLLTYGGWNEAVYLSAEVRDARRNMVRALILGIAAVTVLYVLINLAYLRVLGLEGVAASSAVAADTLNRILGERGAQIISILVVLSALTSANATIITGARTNYTLGRDFPPFAFLGRWSERADVPVNSLLVQGALALGLVLLGSLTRKGFETMVEYTAPVFWLFFLLVGISLFVLRRKEPDTVRPFRVPLYPLTPLLFCLTSAYLLYSSLAYTGAGALIGVSVLLVGVLVQAVYYARARAYRPHLVTEGES
jgi:basic amino acid/polyamine antiporter, APA family